MVEEDRYCVDVLTQIAAVRAALRDGRAMDAWRRMVAAQGGDPDAELPVAKESHVITAPSDGVLTRLDALAVGVSAWRLGAGRARKEDPVQAGAGVVWHAGVGERVEAGQVLFTCYTETSERLQRGVETLAGAVTIDTGAEPFERTLVIDRITA